MTSNTKTKEERQALGLCRFCDAPQIPGSVLCQPHRERERERERAKYAERKASRVCIIAGCGQQAVSGFIRCTGCHAKYTAYQCEYKREARRRQREAVRARRAEQFGCTATAC